LRQAYDYWQDQPGKYRRKIHFFRALTQTKQKKANRKHAQARNDIIFFVYARKRRKQLFSSYILKPFDDFIPLRARNIAFTRNGTKKMF